MSRTDNLSESLSTRSFHDRAERLVMGLGGLVATLGMVGVCRPALQNLQDLSGLAQPLGTPVEAATHDTDWVWRTEIESVLLLVDGVGVYAVGRRHRDHRQLHEGLAELLHAESLLDTDSSFDDGTGQP